MASDDGKAGIAKAADLSVSNDELLDLMSQVKAGGLSIDDAIAAARRTSVTAKRHSLPASVNSSPVQSPAREKNRRFSLRGTFRRHRDHTNPAHAAASGTIQEQNGSTGASLPPLSDTNDTAAVLKTRHARTPALARARIQASYVANAYQSDALLVRPGTLVEILSREGGEWLCRHEGEVGFIKMVYLKEADDDYLSSASES
ncbi:uncharacterized protein MONBRDRAFT_37570 [Monosiga brevicollis MX1]|uniref:SH3 domain-containing protein n=1 Tax=Monosiga brevicollis TaxID=81824 RepID=A9V2L0_MONBE|nr:uncharacterized protein MONBRDRAFT_37570 [Monosiga brevicollis MX1]EDQ88394.1 predicted protein [Monosiga brevicollis MX1]|eukprot:XP_001746987.1 hypothetical protein [Monosiga brevicollis MX1]